MPTLQNEEEGSIFSEAGRAKVFGPKNQKFNPERPKQRGKGCWGKGWQAVVWGAL